ncbi:MAG: hypothetical protein U0169_06990 [Polyangiaceae bacterium]
MPEGFEVDVRAAAADTGAMPSTLRPSFRPSAAFLILGVLVILPSLACSNASTGGAGTSGSGGGSGAGGSGGTAGTSGSGGTSSGDCTVVTLPSGSTWFRGFPHGNDVVLYDGVSEAFSVFTLPAFTKSKSVAVPSSDRGGFTATLVPVASDADYVYSDEGSNAHPRPAILARSKWDSLGTYETAISSATLPENYEYTNVGATYAVVTRVPTDREPRPGVGVVKKDGTTWTTDLPARPEGVTTLVVTASPGTDLVFTDSLSLVRTPIDKYTPTKLFEAALPTNVGDRTSFGIIAPKTGASAVFFRYIGPASAAMASGVYSVPLTGGTPKKIGAATDVIVPVGGKLVGASGDVLGRVPQEFFTMNEDGSGRTAFASCGAMKENVAGADLVVTDTHVVLSLVTKVVVAKRK